MFSIKPTNISGSDLPESRSRAAANAAAIDWFKLIQPELSFSGR